MNLAGFGPLLRLTLHRDRVKLPVWLLSLTVLTFYFANAIRWVYPDEADLDSILGFMAGPAGTVMSGPGYGFDRPTHAAVFAGVYAAYLYLGAALMTVLLVIRHTRAEEERGRLELVLVGEVGRHVPLVVTGLVMTAASLVLGLLSVIALLPTGYPVVGACTIGAGMAMVAFVFGAVAMVTAQLVEHARTAVGLAAVVLGAAMVIRGAGDVLQRHGSWLSWFSPIAWAQQTRPFADERWWPLTGGLVLGAVLVTLAIGLQARRDHGAGLLPPRSGRASAPRWIRSPFTLMLRLERASILGWGAALLVLGGLYGSLTDAVGSSLGDLDDSFLVDALGGDPSRLVDGYLATCALVNAYVALCYSLVSTHRVVTEEREGRAGLVLAGPVGRIHWSCAGVASTLVGTTVVLGAAGLGLGVAAAVVTGDGGHVVPAIAGTLLYLPAITVLAAVGVLGHGLRPGLFGVAWAVAIFSMIVGYLGFALDLPGIVVDLSPLGHVARVPLESQDPLPVVVSVAAAAVLLVAGVERFRRRDLVAG